MKTFKIIYCYGGRFVGDTKYTRIIHADNSNEAIKILKDNWNVEDILFIEEVI
jgi:hypothetical protein